MPLFPLPVEEFPGLNLTDDPSEVGFSGAIDLLNVDLDQRGRVRCRSGFAKFTAAAASSAYHTVAPFYKTDGTKQLIAAFGGVSGAINALNTSGGVVASQSTANTTFGSVARFAAPGSEYAYVAVAGTGAATVYRWDGATWTTPTWTGTAPTGRHLATWQNRLVNARRAGTSNGDSVSTVRFSNITPGPPPAAQPETWNANDFVELSPGDGEEITGMIAWGTSLFVFKESKFFVFYGTTTNSSGNPVFNYRPIYGQGLSSAGGPAYRALTSGPEGVYFVNRRGVWLTTGGPPKLISTAIDPIFRGNANNYYQGGVLNQASIGTVAATWYDNRLYIAYPSGSNTANDKVLVFDSQSQSWLLWSLPASSLATFRVSNVDELVLAVSSGTFTTLTIPTGVSATAITGGSLAAGTYYYKVTALNANGETGGTGASPMEVSATLSGPLGSVQLSWGAVSGATGYRVYRGTSSGGESVYFAPGNVTTFTDTGGAGTAGTVPTTNTATVTGADIGRYNITSGYTLDGGDGLTTGAAITSRYQSGFDNLAPPRRFAAHYLFGNTRKRFRKWKVSGTGNVTFGIAHDMGSVGTTQTLTLGTPPATRDSWYNRATRGQLISYQLSGTSPWTVGKLTAYLAGSEPPLLGNPSDA